MNWNGCERKWSWPKLRHNLIICLEGPRKVAKKPRQDRPVTRPRFEPGVSRIRVTSIVASARNRTSAVQRLSSPYIKLSRRTPTRIIYSHNNLAFQVTKQKTTRRREKTQAARYKVVAVTVVTAGHIPLGDGSKRDFISVVMSRIARPRPTVTRYAVGGRTDKHEGDQFQNMTMLGKSFFA
jgi:hypothetical protein